MTCREKLMLERPDLIDEEYLGGCFGCPSMRNYLPDPEVCGTRVMSDDDCRRCWDREIPGTENIEKENEVMTTTKKTKAELLDELEQANQNVRDLKNEIKNLERYKQYEDMADEIKALHTAFMNSGFTNEQAFDLLKTMTQSMMPAAMRSVGL